MSGKPAYITPFGSGNFPAGSNPWNGQPASVAPPNPYFVPGVTFKPEYENYEFGRTDSNQNTANAWATVGALQWAYNHDTGSTFTHGAAIWDAYLGAWMTPILNGSSHPAVNVKMGGSSGALATFYTDSSATSPNTAVVAVNPANGVGFLFDNTNFAPFPAGTVEPVSGIASQLASVLNAAAWFQDGQYYFVGFLPTGGVSKILATAWHNSTWPTHGGWSGLACPTTWSTGFANSAVPTVAVCNFPLGALALSSYVGIQNNSPGSLAVISNGGNTFTDITSSSPLSTSGTYLNGLAADDANQLLLMSYTDGSGVTRVAYSSNPAGGSWTVAAGTFGSQLYCLGVACVGGLWAIAFADSPQFNIATGALPSSGVFLSADKGATWVPAWGYVDTSASLGDITTAFSGSHGLQCLWGSPVGFVISWADGAGHPYFVVSQPQGAAGGSPVFTGAL